MAIRVPPGGSSLGSFLSTTSALALGGPRSQIVNGWAPDAPSGLDIDFTTGTLDSRITFARGSTATYYNSSGLIASAASGAPRFDYDPLTLAPRGLPLEEQRTNIALGSSTIGDGSWAPYQVTPTTNNATAPNGALEATLLTVTGSHSVIYQAVDFPDTTIYTQSIYAKKGTSDWLNITMQTGGEPVAYFNVATGTLGSFDTPIIATAIQDVGNGWFRCSATRAATAGSEFVTLGQSDANGSRAVTTGRTIYVWGAQMEAGNLATSYIPTTSAAVTRSADTAEMTGANFSSWYNASAGTFVAEYRPQSVSGTQPVVSINDTTANEAIRLYGSGTDPKAIVIDGGTTQADLDAGTIAVDTFYKLGFAFTLNDFAACLDAGTVTTDAAGTLPTVTQLQFHTDIAGNVANLHIKRLQFFNTRKSNSELQVLTGVTPAAGAGALVAQPAVAASTTGISGSTSPGVTSTPTAWSTTDKIGTFTYSNGNLTALALSGGSVVRSNNSQSTGKFYFENRWDFAPWTNDTCGIATGSANLSTWAGNGAGGLIVFAGPSGPVWRNGTSSGVSLGAITAINTVIGIAVDLINQRAWLRVNGGNWNGSGTADPTTNVGGIDISSVFSATAAFAATGPDASTGKQVTTNFGATTFAFAAPSGFAGGPAGPVITMPAAGSAVLSSTTGVSGSLITDTTLNASAAALSSTTGLVRAIANPSALTAQAATVIGLGTGAGAAAIGAGALSSRPATLASTGLTQTIGSGALVDGPATLSALAVSGSTGTGNLNVTAADIDSLGYVEQGGVSIMIGGEWQRTTPYVRVGGAWKPATAWANVNGVWKRAA